MLQALVLTAAIIATVLAALQWFVFLLDLQNSVSRYKKGKKYFGLGYTLPAIFLWVIYFHL
jgi:hypothetical protein